MKGRSIYMVMDTLDLPIEKAFDLLYHEQFLKKPDLEKYNEWLINIQKPRNFLSSLKHRKLEDMTYFE